MHTRFSLQVDGFIIINIDFIYTVNWHVQNIRETIYYIGNEYHQHFKTIKKSFSYFVNLKKLKKKCTLNFNLHGLCTFEHTVEYAQFGA